jgi:N-acetylmuramoyl-L-alanine amidase
VTVAGAIDITAAKPVGTAEYTVRPGDCMTSIATSHGHFWQTLWDAPENADLKTAREDPNVLLTGDKVFIPDLREKVESCAAESKHRFRKKGIPAMLRLRLLFGNQPRKDLKFTLAINEVETKGVTDAQGRIEVPLPPMAREGTLILHAKSGDERFVLDMGAVEPVDCVVGVQQRLLNLGFEVEITGEADAKTSLAVASFQGQQGLEPSGRINARLIESLERVHGC